MERPAHFGWTAKKPEPETAKAITEPPGGMATVRETCLRAIGPAPEPRLTGPDADRKVLAMVAHSLECPDKAVTTTIGG